MATNKASLRSSTLAALFAEAVQTGDYTALEEYNPTESEINNLIATQFATKDAKGRAIKGTIDNLTEAQKVQMNALYSGKFNNYGSPDSSKVKSTESTDPLSTKEGLQESNYAGDGLDKSADMSWYGDANTTAPLADNNLVDNYTRPDYTNVIAPDLRSVGTLQDQLGVNWTYDLDTIQKIYNDATQAGYGAEQQSGANNSYYRMLADAQNTALDTIRQQYGSAVAAGANKGMQAASMLSSILGTTQQANEQATQLAIDRQTRANQYAQQLAQDAKDALSYSNETASNIATLSRQLYNDDIQRETAELSYNQGINTDYAGIMANRYTQDANVLNNLRTAQAGMFNNNVSGIAQIQSALAAANAQKYVADQNKETTSNVNYGGKYIVANK